ncbi:hypothetical protein D3C87_1811080 [compost metagenome]
MRKRIRLSIHSNIPFLHHFKQCRLRFGGGAVDLIGKKNIGHDRARTEMEHFIARMIDGHPGDITWQNIRIALDPAVFTGHGS